MSRNGRCLSGWIPEAPWPTRKEWDSNFYSIQPIQKQMKGMAIGDSAYCDNVA